MPETTPEFGTPNPKSDAVPRAAAYVVLKDGEGSVLIVRAKHGLFLPGGGSEPGESPESTVVRECLEEIGCEIEVGSHLGAAIQHFTASDGIRYRGTFNFFLASVLQEGAGSAEHDALWLQAADLSGRLFHESHEWAVRRAFG